MESNLEKSIRFGVTSLETAKELEWEGDYIFCWVKLGLKYSTYDLHRASEVDRLKYEAYLKNWVIDVIPAPQAHEILDHLPESIGAYTLRMTKGSVYYICQNYYAEVNGKILYFRTENGNLADALAKLYLAINTKKEENNAMD